jgi:hypothetical protein
MMATPGRAARMARRARWRYVAELASATLTVALVASIVIGAHFI